LVTKKKHGALIGNIKAFQFSQMFDPFIPLFRKKIGENAGKARSPSVLENRRKSVAHKKFIIRTKKA
jgi:hypothetical protein